MSKIIKNNFFYLILAIIISANILPFIINNVLAVEPPPGGVTYTTTKSGLENPLGSNDIYAILQKIIGYLIKIGAPIVAIMVIYGGYLMLTAGENPEQVKNGIDTIKWAAIGYTIVICSWGIIYILNEVLGAKIPTQ